MKKLKFIIVRAVISGIMAGILGWTLFPFPWSVVFAGSFAILFWIFFMWLDGQFCD
jgi:hypothetical protein